MVVLLVWQQWGKMGSSTIVLHNYYYFKCGDTWDWWPSENVQSSVYTMVHWATDVCCYRSLRSIYKGDIRYLHTKNCSFNVLLRDRITTAYFIHLPLIIISFSFCHSFFSLYFLWCRWQILCMKNCPRQLPVEYFMSFNFSRALKVSL